MVNIENILYWKQTHFIIYLYLVVADADNKRNPDETELLKRKITSKFGDTEKIRQIFNQVNEEVISHSHNDKLEVIEQYTQSFYWPEELKNEILYDLYDLIVSDMEIHAMEKEVYEVIKLALSAEKEFSLI